MAEREFYAVYDAQHRTHKYYPPARGLSRELVDKDLQDTGFTRVRDLDEWASDAFIPKTAVDWGIAGATLLPVAGIGAKVGQLGWQGGKLALREASALSRAGRMTAIGTAPVAGALGGAAYEHLAEDPSPTPYSQAAIQGLVGGLVGVASTPMVNALSRTFLGRQQLAFKQDPAALSEWVNSVKAGMAADPTPRGLARVAIQHEFSRAADAMMTAGKIEAVRLSKTQTVKLPKLAGFLQQAGMEVPDPIMGTFTVREAMDAISQIGPELWKRVGKPSPTKAVLDDLRFRTMADFGQQVGKDAASAYGRSLETYGLWMETDRLLAGSSTLIFPQEGGVSFAGLQQAIKQRYSDPKTGKWAEDRLGRHYDTLVETAFRGPQGAAGAGDAPSRFYVRLPLTGVRAAPAVSIGEASGGRFLSKFAGDPNLLPQGIFAPLGGIPYVTQLGGIIPGKPKIPREELEAARGGPTAPYTYGGIPSGR